MCLMMCRELLPGWALFLRLMRGSVVLVLVLVLAEVRWRTTQAEQMALPKPWVLKTYIQGSVFSLN
jgi:hypothetical protein